MNPELMARQKVLVANRGEIAVRILESIHKLGLKSVSIYTRVDATAPHVLLADESVALASYAVSRNQISETDDANAYLDAEAIVAVCQDYGVNLVHPGYGFLSENATFARLLAAKGITLLGPDAQTIEDMGLKHKARELAIQAGVPVVPGSQGLLTSLQEAEDVAMQLGYPVMLKATAGGGGTGLVICRDASELRDKLASTEKRAKTLFKNGGVFMEKYFDASRHIEVQIFGDGLGGVIHLGERECSIQRRHQKLIEEAPSPFLSVRHDLRRRMYDASVNMGKLIKYKSAGTVEFLVDERNGDFYFLEMNTRLQVEHGVTEMLYSVDIVYMMIRQGLEERMSPGVRLQSLDQDRFAAPPPYTHVVELRVYSENPAQNFAPCVGVLQDVKIPETNQNPNLRVDTGISKGLHISTFYDPLLAKVLCKSSSRDGAIRGLLDCLSTELVIQGPPNNLAFLAHILHDPAFKSAEMNTQWIDGGKVLFTPSAFTVLSPGIEATVQSLPPRDIGRGIPPSGPIDPLAFQIGNILVGNARGCEGLEVVVPPGFPDSMAFAIMFYVSAVIAVTGPARVLLNEEEVSTWSRISVPAGAKLRICSQPVRPDKGGLRCYLTVNGGFPAIPLYLGSKSTSMDMGGYQGRALRVGDMIDIASTETSAISLPTTLIPTYPSHWNLYALPGPQDDEDFITSKGVEQFYAHQWKVSPASNRMGIRLEPGEPSAGVDNDSIIEWARPNGGEGGSHPSNLLDNGYARGSINLNGDTPVILTVEGPNMGGYVCVSTIASGDHWKFGQLRPGNTVKMVRISWRDAVRLRDHLENWLKTVQALASGIVDYSFDPLGFELIDTAVQEPKLYISPKTSELKPRVVYRQAGDSAILVEYGEMTLDLACRARIHALETALKSRSVRGIKELAPCVRSTMVHFDITQATQEDILKALIETEQSLPESMSEMSFKGRKITFPIVLDDRWTKDALIRYMQTMRAEAVYLPSNIDYLAKCNGIKGGAEEALKMLVSSPWLILAVGFYLGCPFLVPIDPRKRIVAQKMNPSRTYTPRGAVGIAGPVGAIYPVESPGGYQLFGRTLPIWQPWGSGGDFKSSRPWLLEPFDQIVFEPVTEEEYIHLEREFDSGQYLFKIESALFSMSDYLRFVSSVKDETAAFKEGQAKAVYQEEIREEELLKKWRASKVTSTPSQISETDYTPHYACASMSGVVSKIQVAVGDVIRSGDQVVIILESMKTEISVAAGDDNVGRSVCGFKEGIVGSIVEAGDKLVFFDK